MGIANRIVKLIEKKGISRYQLAKLSGVPYTTLIKVIDGTTKNPQIDTLNSIARALDVSIEDITQPWASEIIGGLLETYKISYEELAEETGLTVDYLTCIDDLVPGPWDYDSMDKVAKVLHISNQPIRAALARQEPTAYDGPQPTVEEAFEDTDFSEHMPNKQPYYSLNEKDERDIAKDLERMLESLESNEALAFNGEPMDEETKRLFAISLENSMRLGKEMAKKKFTPNKYRD